MALRDVNNFQFLREAIIQRFRNPNLKSFKGIPYEPPTNPHSIFGRTYTTFRELIGKGLNLHQYLNIGERSVLENLYQNLQSDINLRFLNDPKNALNDQKFEIPDQYYQEQPKDAAAKQAEPVPTSQTATAPVAAGTMSKPLPTSTVTPPRTVIPQAATEKLPTQTASETERVESTEPATAKEVPLAFQKAFENEPEYVTNPTELTPEQPTETGAPAPTQESSAISTPQTETSQSTGPSIGSFTTTNPGLKFQPGFSDAFKNFGSTAQRFAGTNLGRIGEGLKGIGRGITGPGLTSGANFLGRVGVGGMNAGISLSNQVSRGATNLSTSSKRLLPIFIGIILFVVFIVNVIGGISGTTPTGEAAPISSNVGLDYTLPLKDSSVQPLDIKAQVQTSFPGAKLEYWDKIVQASIAAGFNPALALALWIEETGASQATLLKNGGSEIVTSGSLSKGHLGCAPKEDQTIDESLSCLFKFVAANNFTNDQFAQFMALYSSGPPNNPFANNPYFPKNLKDWYSKLVPTGAGAIVAVKPSPAPIQAIASCPVPGGRISTPSYNANPSTGHCGGGYSYTCKCGTSGRRAKAIDVPTNGQSVVLPTVNGQSVNWKLIEGPYPIDNGEGGGQGYTFQASQGNDIWYLDMLHLNTSALGRGVEYSSGTPVATTVIDHVHMTMGKNLSSAPVAGTGTDCDPSWLPSDFLCQ